jgi:hypothetical protein
MDIMLVFAAVLLSRLGMQHKSLLGTGSNVARLEAGKDYHCAGGDEACKIAMRENEMGLATDKPSSCSMFHICDSDEA